MSGTLAPSDKTMTLRFVPAIVLAVLLYVLFILARAAFRRWKWVQKPRRRDSDPAWLQVRRQWRADLKRFARGLRFPSVAQKKKHMAFRKRFLADPGQYIQNVAAQITSLKVKPNAR